METLTNVATNNKGMTLVELLITFSLLMIIVVGMFNLILDEKINLDNKRMTQSISEYSNFLNNDIHYELITKRPIVIAIKTTSVSEWSLEYNNTYENREVYSGDEDSSDYTPCGISGNTFYVNSFVKDKNITIQGNANISNMCKNTYPCAIYVYYNPQNISNNTTSPIFKTIAINTVTSGSRGYGVRFNNVFEELPYYDQLDKTKTTVTMQFDGEYFVIDYPIYLTDNDIDYGFKIAYPVSNVGKKVQPTDEDDNDDTDDETNT